MKFSIIIPVYNKQTYIQRCLESLKNQTYKNIEVIIIDDGSTDQSSIIIKDIISNDDRFRCYYQENKGCSTARNEGIKKATGEFLTFVDADDYVTECRIEHAYNILKSQKIDLVQQNFFQNKLRNEIVDNITPAVWNKIFKTEIILKNRITFPTGTHMGEDLAFVLKYLYFAETIEFSKIPVYHYEINENSVMSISNISDKFDIFISLKDIDQFYINKNIDIAKEKNINFKKFFVEHGINNFITFILKSPTNIIWKIKKIILYRKKIQEISKRFKYKLPLVKYLFFVLKQKIK